ncbi:MAG: hypothetical protein GJ676_04345 [Rhodobacteraceae bacterium]|nr:hypothetical protein [Paracoccaceae bacterium]
MFLELIGVIFAGFAVAGVVMLINKLTGGRLPRWTAPVGAGLGMIIATIANEYSWYQRTSGVLPEGLVVAETVEHSSFYRPWTLAAPYINRFAAVDTASVQTHIERPGQRMADIYFFGRWAPVNELTVVADCNTDQSALLSGNPEFGDDGTIDGLNWARTESDDAIMAVLCEGHPA